MNKTPNYQLNQWDKSDRIRMEDFNADNAKIEAAILGANEAAAAAAASGLKVKTGSFNGTGSTGTRTYSLGFKPKLLFLRTDNENLSYMHEKALIATDILCITYYNSGAAPMLGEAGKPCTFSDDGFSLALSSNASTGLNASGSKLYYWTLY